MPESWVQPFTTSPSPRARLVCFHEAGGNAAQFRTWAGQLPDTEVLAVQIPLERQRHAPGAARTVPALVVELVDDLAPRLGELPVVFLGQSFGALFAYEAAWELERRGGSLPVALVAVSAPAPHLLRADALGELPDDALLEEMRRRFDLELPPNVSGALRRLALSVIRGYAQLAESYVRPRPHRLPVAIDAVRATEDRSFSREVVEAWADYAGAGFGFHELPGPHLVLKTQEAAVRELVAARLRGSRRPRP